MAHDSAEDSASWPFGDRLTAAAEALTRAIEAAHRREGLTPLDWRVLHTVSRASPTALAPLLTTLEAVGSLDGVPEALENLEDRGWLVTTRTGPRGLTIFQLSPEGEQSHDRLFVRQNQLRQQVLAGISADEQATALRVLERVVSNLSDGSMPGRSAGESD
jgi:DNA-binding MarR family transcriptional regulator